METIVKYYRSGVPNLQDLKPDDLRQSQSHNNRSEVRNKCNALESSPNHSLLQSVEKLSSRKLCAKMTGHCCSRSMLSSHRKDAQGNLLGWEKGVSHTSSRRMHPSHLHALHLHGPLSGLLKAKKKTQVLICFPSKSVQCLTRRGYKMWNELMQVLRIRVTGSDVEGILRRNVELSVHVRK